MAAGVRRVLGLAILGGLGFAAYRAVASGALGSGPTATSSLDEIARAGTPTGLRAELDAEAARRTLEDRFAAINAARGQDLTPDDILSGIPLGPLADQVRALEAAGRARFGTSGVWTTGATTPADRALIAEAECRRASAMFGLPAYLIDDCARGLGTAARWRYTPPGARAALDVNIGSGGLGTAVAPAYSGGTTRPTA